MSVTTPTVKRATVNGIELAYEVIGSGEPLVLLHGAFETAGRFGPVAERLARGRQVIAVNLQSHGRTPAVDRPMRFETMADDVAALIDYLGLERADVMGYSLGGGVALRTAIQHPSLVRRLVLVSTAFRRNGWLPESVAAFDAMGPEMADVFRQTPLYTAYAEVAPRVEDWPVLIEQVTTMLKVDYDWTEETRALPMPVLIVAGDADGLPVRHEVEFFELLGGGQRDAVWDRSGMTHHGLAILPRTTHYDIAVSPALAAAVELFLGEQ